MARRSQTQSPAETAPVSSLPPTVLEHIREFRARLFWVVASVLVASSAGYLIKDEMLAVLTHPLGNQQLYYLTPIGGLSFIIKLCFYFGILVSVPVMVYHLYRYLQPLMGKQRRPVKRYFFFSFVLAVMGICFAYFVSLPAALHFLTDFNMKHITAMLTVDAYLGFVTSYLLGAALLFQIPLILLIIDKITPLTPGGLMKYQRHVILVAFIIAAIISPTPDIINQALLAGPIIAMYQVGVMLIWFQSSRRKRQQRRMPAAPIIPEKDNSQPKPAPVAPQPTPLVLAMEPAPMPIKQKTKLISDVGPRSVRKQTPGQAPMVQPVARTPRPLSRSLIPPRQVRLERPQGFAPIDGIIAR